MFKDIPNYEDYQINEFGKILRKQKTIQKKDGKTQTFVEKTMSESDNGVGYKFVRLSKEGKRKNEYIHRLVYKTFGGEIPDGYEINHIDHNKSNNHVSNLEVVTKTENIIKMINFYGKTKSDTPVTCIICGCIKLKNTASKCRKCWNKSVKIDKLDEEEINYILSEIAKRSMKDVSKEYGLSDNGLRKRLKANNLPYKTRDIKKFFQRI